MLELAETIERLKKKGYTIDFNLKENFLECSEKKHQLCAHEFNIDEVYRFDEMTDPADQSILYAISAKHSNLKGILVNGYGIYSDPISNEMAEALSLKKKN